MVSRSINKDRWADHCQMLLAGYLVLNWQSQNVYCSNIYVTNVVFENDPFGLNPQFLNFSLTGRPPACCCLWRTQLVHSVALECESRGCKSPFSVLQILNNNQQGSFCEKFPCSPNVQFLYQENEWMMLIILLPQWCNAVLQWKGPEFKPWPQTFLHVFFFGALLLTLKICLLFVPSSFP